jgi:hypothetical protein
MIAPGGSAPPAGAAAGAAETTATPLQGGGSGLRTWGIVVGSIGVAAVGAGVQREQDIRARSFGGQEMEGLHPIGMRPVAQPTLGSRCCRRSTIIPLDCTSIGRPMSSLRCTSLLCLLLAAGCLQPGTSPEGIKLVSGSDVGDVGFIPLDGAGWITFNRRKATATLTKGAVRDLWIASCDGTQQRQIIADWSDRWSPTGAGDFLFIMVDERQVTSGAAGQGPTESVGTLVRTDWDYSPRVAFENVSTFALGPYNNRLLYRQVLGGNQTPGLFLWDGQDQLRLGDVANVYDFDAQIAGSGMAYFVLGSDRVLSRLDKLTDTKQDLHPNVISFYLRGDEQYAALSLATGTTVVLNIQSGQDIPLASPNPFALGFADQDRVTYSQSAIGAAPAEYHTLDLTTGADTFVVLPAPLVNLAAVMPRPQSDEVLYLDNQGHGVFFGQNDQQERRAVPVTMLSPQFSPEGQYLIYIDQQPATEAQPGPHGLLMVQDAELVNPPSQISTPGMAVDAGSFFFIQGPSTDGGVSYILVFWASIVVGSADLYFANYQTGDLRVVASSIGNVQVDSQRIFGTVNESAQDATGDLVVQDVLSGKSRLLAHAVSEATQWYDPNPGAQFVRVGYVVRGRASSDHDGVWLTTLEPPGQDGGQ